MALHISEIAVRLAIGPGGPAETPAATPEPGAGGLSPVDHEAIVQDCVQRVLAALRAEEAR